MLLVALSVLLHSTPPLVQGPPEDVARAPRQQPAEVPRPSLGLYFAPLSLFSLSLWVEADVPLVGGLDVFANVGGGPLGQLGFDVGLRYYVLGTPLDGFYFDARVSGFALPAQALFMLGPSWLIGHGWRVRRFTLSIGVGATSWYGVTRSNGMSGFFGRPAVEAEVVLFPGITQPPGDRPGVQPTARVSLGTWF